VRALLSVYDKEGLVELAQGLSDLGWELVASGNTSARLAEAGIAHTEVAEVTGSPEMLGGRVKTLHPKIHGGILADRSKPEHLADLEANGIDAIDLVVVNLYPFSSDPSVELIDVGGPTMVRAAAKNHAHVGVVTSPADYAVVLEELRRSATLSAATRRRLARAAFAHTAAYDAAIVAWLDSGGPSPVDALDGATEADRAEAELSVALPPTLHLTLERTEVLRYGENPHQRGSRYRVGGAVSWWDDVVQHGGSALSYLNLFDGDAAWRLVHELAADAADAANATDATAATDTVDGREEQVAVAIIKHANPCGAAVASDLVTAYERALECDPLSAFGGVVAIGGHVTAELAETVAAGPQADVIIASSYAPEAVERLVARRKATRLLSGPAPERAVRQLRSLGASVLVQDVDTFVSPRREWRTVTRREPSAEEWRDLVLAWRVCGRTTSNAIAVVTNGQAVGVGAGQQSRVVAAEIAVQKAGERAKGGAGASDAFFPFPDGLLVLADAGVTAVVQPGGSVKDGDVIAAADEAGLAMVLTGERHFKH
jgi:phosphoribosylaminoimidazolecarboxamide formyltransferase / IMP cyclohydrolase